MARGDHAYTRAAEAAWSEPTLADVIRAGRRTFQSGQRVDLGDIARAVGIGRTTLHRWVGRRERFLGLVIASLGESALRRAEGEVPPTLRAAERVAAVLELCLRGVAASVPLRTFIRREPEMAGRVLLSPDGDVTHRLEVAIEQLIVRSVEARRRPADPHPRTLARILLRTADTFFYADLIGSGEPDMESAIVCVRMILRGYWAGAPAGM
jgi:AcrR family transcriptional regulator